VLSEGRLLLSASRVSVVPAAGATLESAIGPLTVLASESGICSIFFDDERDGPCAIGGGAADEAATSVLRRALEQLAQYFEGVRTAFELPLDLAGTPFQMRVWAEVVRIPYGKTASYGELARRVGSASGARAVGGANARNPLPIVVPCHRVVGARGQLTGFGGGLARKAFLLDLESGGAPAHDSIAGRSA